MSLSQDLGKCIKILQSPLQNVIPSEEDNIYNFIAKEVKKRAGEEAKLNASSKIKNINRIAIHTNIETEKLLLFDSRHPNWVAPEKIEAEEDSKLPLRPPGVIEYAADCSQLR